jgi:plasmid maintenance system antidote protein VapI
VDQSSGPDRHQRPGDPEPAIDRAGCPHDLRAGAACRSCAQLRRRAWGLVDVDQLSYRDAARRMKLPVERVRALVEQECDRQDLKRYKRDSIPTALVRALVDDELARRPGLCRAEIADWLGVTQADLDRQLGDGERGQQRIGIAVASRLAIALGRAPHELDGC